MGYDSAYPRDLISENGGGILTPAHSPDAVAQVLAGLAANRDSLRLLSNKAVRDGSAFTDARVFRHRAELIKAIPA